MKSKIRNEILDIRNNLNQDFVDNNSKIIIDKVNEFIKVNNFKNILVYMDMKNEVQASKLINNFKVNYYITKTIDNTTLKITKYDKNLLKKHSFGYYQIDTTDYIDESLIDLVIVPGVAFDTKMQRIGFGKGYYDRLLSKCTNAFKLGIGYQFQIVDEIQTNQYDINLDMIITESNNYHV